MIIYTKLDLLKNLAILFEIISALANWPATPAFARPLGSTGVDEQFWANKWTDKQGETNNSGQTNRQTDRQTIFRKCFKFNPSKGSLKTLSLTNEIHGSG